MEDGSFESAEMIIKILSHVVARYSSLVGSARRAATGGTGARSPVASRCLTAGPLVMVGLS